jgi:hypothetical protein
MRLRLYRLLPQTEELTDPCALDRRRRRRGPNAVSGIESPIMDTPRVCTQPSDIPPAADDATSPLVAADKDKVYYPPRHLALL